MPYTLTKGLLWFLLALLLGVIAVAAVLLFSLAGAIVAVDQIVWPVSLVVGSWSGALIAIVLTGGTGIAARDVCECLSIQLRERNRFDPAMQALVQNLHLVLTQNTSHQLGELRKEQ